MSAEIRQQFLNLPRVLRETVEKGRPEYEDLVRRTRWGEVPIYIVGSGASFAVGLAGAYAFENLLGWPVVVRTPEEFQAYSQSALRPRSIVLVISWKGATELLEVVRAARARGATVLALTGDGQSPLAKAADGVFMARGGDECGQGFAADVVQLAAMHCLTAAAAHVLKRPSPQIETLEGELRALPEHVEWVLTQLPEAVRSLAGELAGGRGVSVVAGGCYYSAALLGARTLRGLGRLRVQVLTPDEMDAWPGEAFENGEVVVVLSGSRCRVKRQVHILIERLKPTEARILAVTDHNEPEITRRAALAVLLPNLSENVGSIVVLAFLGWISRQLAAPQARGERRSSGT